jgi:hypothetical protein
LYRVADDGGAGASGARARTIRSPDDAEQVAAEWMRHFGFEDARCTAAGTDGGVDVRSREAVAQVKAQLTPVGRPELQALYGVARSESRRPLFFSLMSYTAAAMAWADEVQMALFRFDHAGTVEAVNLAAERLLVAAGGSRGPRTAAWPVRLSDRAGRAAIARERRGVLLAERVTLAGLGWIWVQLVRLDYTVPTRRAVAHRATTLAFDLVSGAPFPLPGVDPTPAGRNASGYVSGNAGGNDRDPETVGEKGPLPATMESAALLRQITDTWEKLEAVTRPAVVERYRAVLEHLGVPWEALTVSPSAGERVLAPVFVGLLEHRRDSRVVVCSGINGASLSDLASHLTSRLPGALEEIVGRVRAL